MKMSKKVILAVALLCLSTMIFAQSQSVQKKSTSNKETYVENEYLNDKRKIFRRLSNSNNSREHGNNSESNEKMHL